MFYFITTCLLVFHLLNFQINLKQTTRSPRPVSSITRGAPAPAAPLSVSRSPAVQARGFRGEKRGGAGERGKRGGGGMALRHHSQLCDARSERPMGARGGVTRCLPHRALRQSGGRCVEGSVEAYSPHPPLTPRFPTISCRGMGLSPAWPGETPDPGGQARFTPSPPKIAGGPATSSMPPLLRGAGPSRPGPPPPPTPLSLIAAVWQGRPLPGAGSAPGGVTAGRCGGRAEILRLAVAEGIGRGIKLWFTTQIPYYFITTV